ncbi:MULTISPECIES: ADP-ribosylglycohydrolase family protein [Glycomyces]|uniref:ADP-ribosylglycohydrolase n=2 Tax=Glycomyces TaxID=58113 RepID=A0A9X3PE10_9ACTN|nr:ADP-ribosylglycohydrolase family protein [Glycomyces lechevalierae]MDA1383859.1 ADP-ribosylglycohydrolase family protein [Glycomyces lechevalierae]MDR7341150.1 ADP-ribosylglycohydrolase [Glycomyces lechevalierae]
MRLSWTQPEDLLPHALEAARLDGRDQREIRRRWTEAGGSPEPIVSGASPEPAPEHLRTLARTLLTELDELPEQPALAAAEPEDLDAILSGGGPALEAPGRDFEDRLLGAWLGRAAGCLLGKPVEKLPLEGIRAIARATGNWPLDSYFTEIGLDPWVAGKYPWNRRSRPNSLAENIDGMPEDDDLNFPLIALTLLERHGRDFTTGDVAQAWLDLLPGGRVFTAERIAYRNLLDGYAPETAGRVRNPFRDWIGAQIRTDVYGWTNPGDPATAARLAWTDARLSHGRNGIYGAMFVAAASAAAVTGAPIETVIDAGLSVVPPTSRYFLAVMRGLELGEGDLSDEAAVDALHAEYGHLHWVHVLNNAALLAFALARGAGDFERTITLAVSGGWDTDSVGATAGALTGAVTGAKGLPPRWIDPLDDRLASSVPGFAGTRFSALAARTAEVSR